MSKTIDERVVSMQFDNKHFEANVKDTMSTLDKLKAKLNFSGASKGLEEVNTAANKVNMSGLGSAVQSVHAKFSALEIAGITAMSRLTNAAITAGTNMVRALTITPITTGWSEYELKMNSIKTIMASTGEDLDTVNKYLNELNEYSDKTIYSFSDMTQNIGKFTNAGVKLEDAVMAIQGIANVAAVSGANANEASRSMYNFAQALSAGYVKLIDWKSIELANMATVEFKEQLIESAVAVGTLTKTSDGMYKTLEGKVISATSNFNDSLQDQWMTTEVLISTLKDYSDETTEIGKKASKSATQVNTFSKMMDALKESAQSGWARTWELIFGDFEEGTNLWTKVNDVIGGVLNTINDARNALVENTFAKNTKSWKEISKYIEDAGINIEDFKDRLLETGKKHSKAIKKMVKEEKSFDDILNSGNITKEMLTEVIQGYVDEADNATASTKDLTDKLEYFRKVVKEVWRGDYANVDTGRIEKLTAAGYDYYVVQDLVNKTIDDHTVNLEDLTDVQLEHLGYTEQEIEAIHQLGEEAKKSGSSLNELLDDLSKPSGRVLLGEAFGNIGAYFKTIFESVKKAWDSTFDSEFSLYGIIEAFKELTDSMVISEEQANRLTTILQGVFSAVDISWSVASASFMGFMKILDAALHLIFGADVGIGKALEYVANKIIALDKWIEESTIFGSNTKWSDLAAIFVAIGNGIKNCVDAFMALKPVKDLIEGIKKIVIDLFGSVDGALNSLSVENVTAKIGELFTKVTEWLKSLENSEQFGFDLIAGLVQGMADGVMMLVRKAVEVCTTLFTTICDFFGIASPSKLMIAIGGFIILGLTQGLQDSASFLWDTTKSIVSNMMNLITLGLEKGIPFAIEMIKTLSSKLLTILKESEIDLGSLVVAGTLIGTFYTLKKLTDVLETLASPFEGIVNITKSINTAITSISKSLSLKLKASAFKSIATAIGILAAALAALTYVDQGKLWSAVGAVSTLIIVMGGLMILIEKTEKIKDFKDLSRFAVSLVSFAGSLLLIAAAMAIIANIDANRLDDALLSLGLMIAGMAGILFAYGKFIKMDTSFNMDKAGLLFLSMAASMLIMSYAIKTIASVPSEDIWKGVTTIVGLGALVMAFVWVSKFAEGSYTNDAGKMIFKMAIAVGILALTIKLIGTISQADIDKGISVIGSTMLLFGALIAVSHLAGEHTNDAGSMLLKMAVAVGLLALTIKLIATIPLEDIAKGAAVIIGAFALFAGFTALDKVGKGNVDRVGSMLMKMSAGILLLAVAIKIISGMSFGEVMTGLVFIAAVELLFMGIVRVSEYAGKYADKAGMMLWKMSTAILVLVAAIAILSILKPEKVAVGTVAIMALMGMFALLIKSTEKMRASKTVMTTLITLIAAVALLAVAIGVLSILDPVSVATSAGAITALMGVFAVLMTATKYTKVSKNLWQTIGTLTLVVVALAGILALLAAFDVQPSIESATAISILLLSLSASLAILGTVSRVNKSVMTALGYMTLAVAGLAVIMGLLAAFDVQPSISSAIALSTLLIAMAAVTAILSAIGPTATLAMQGALALDAVIVIIGGLVVGIGWLMKNIEGMESSLDKGLEVLVKLGYGLGKAVGSLVSGFADGVLSGLPQIGLYLSQFMINATPFILGTNMINTKAMEGVKTLAESILILTAAEVIQGLTSGLTLFTSLPKIGSDLSAFMINAMPFIMGANLINTTAMEGVKTLAESIIILTGAEVLQGLSSLLTGGSTLSDFGTQLASLGPSLNTFATSVKDIDGESVTTAANAIKSLAQAANEIPDEGGWLAKIVGDNNMGAWGSQLGELGSNIATFAKNLGTFNQDTVTTVECACSAISTLAKAGNEIPNEGGWLSTLVGDNSIASFGNKLAGLGTNIATFVKNLGTFGQEQVTTIDYAVKAINALAKLSNANLSGTNIIIDNFGTKIVEFAKNIKSFVKEMDGVSGAGVTNAVAAIDQLLVMNTNVAGTSVEALMTFGETLKKAGEEGVTGFVDAFKDSTAVSDVKTNTNALAKTAADNLKSEENTKKYKSAGKSFVKGFADGITNNVSLGEAAAESLGSKTLAKLKQALLINSPSKASRELGGYTGEGFVLGIKDWFTKATSVAIGLGNTVKDSLSSTIARISEAISTDIDSQPTIRPVLDLSDVTAGAGTLNSLFNTNPSMGVLANVHAVGSMMNSRQNGANDDVVSAINGLKTALGDNTGNSYTINGITYDDGSNITDAVKSLVRAAKIERRV